MSEDRERGVMNVSDWNMNESDWHSLERCRHCGAGADQLVRGHGKNHDELWHFCALCVVHWLAEQGAPISWTLVSPKEIKS